MTPGHSMDPLDPRRLLYENRKYHAAQLAVIPYNDNWLLVSAYGGLRTLRGEYTTAELLQFFREDHSALTTEFKRRHEADLRAQQYQKQEGSKLNDIEIEL